MSVFVAGAVPAPGIDAPVAWHYGDPLREQRTLATAAGLVDRAHRDVVTVSGPDRLTWLHSICSQHVSELTDGESTESATSALPERPCRTALAGRRSWASTVWIDTEPGAAPDVLAYLEKMRFLKRVELADVSAAWAVLSLVGPAAADVVRNARATNPEAGLRRRVGDRWLIAARWPGPR